MNIAMILAGGSGNRFGGDVPKQYTEVMGKPVLAYTLEVFEKCADIDAIQVVCQPEYASNVVKIAREYAIGKLCHIAFGGKSCPISIRNGVYSLADMLAPTDNVLLHMGVSPLVSCRDISAALAVCRERGCCFTMHPVNICMARPGGENWADRDAQKEDFIELNTPWAFRFGDMLDLYRQHEKSGRPLSDRDYTLSLWLASGRRAWYTPGSPEGRLKITTPHDRDLFEGYLMLRSRRNENMKTPGGSHE